MIQRTSRQVNVSRCCRARTRTPTSGRKIVVVLISSHLLVFIVLLAFQFIQTTSASSNLVSPLKWLSAAINHNDATMPPGVDGQQQQFAQHESWVNLEIDAASEGRRELSRETDREPREAASLQVLNVTSGREHLHQLASNSVRTAQQARVKRWATTTTTPGGRRRTATNKTGGGGGGGGQHQSDDQVTVINGVLRGQVILKCNLKPLESASNAAATRDGAPDENDDEVSLILWYKDNSMVPIYSVDARASPVLEARHKPGGWLEGRSSLKILEEPDEEVDEPGRDGGANRRRRAATPGGRGLEQQSETSFDGAGPIWWPLAPPPVWPDAPARAFGNIPHDKRTGAYDADKVKLSRGSRGDRHRRRAAGGSGGGGKHLVAHLLIDSLSSEDNGYYKCRVDFRRSRSRVQEQEVRIIVPAERPLIRDLTAATPTQGAPLARNNLVGPHNEQARVVLECETSGGYPEPTLTWWRNGRLLDDSYEVLSALDGSILERRGGWDPAPSSLSDPTQGNNVEQQAANEAANKPPPISSRQSNSMDQQQQAQQQQQSQQQPNRLFRNRLELPALTRDDLLANYSCQASNSQLGEPPTSYVMIDMNLRPLRVHIDNERLPVLAHRPLEVVCRAFGSRPAAQVTWYLNKNRLGELANSIERQASPPALGLGAVQVSESISSDSNLTTSVLSFTPQAEHSGQLLTCRAENAFMSPPLMGVSLDERPMQSGPLEAGPASHLEDSWKLEVHYAPRVQLALGDRLAQRPAVQAGHDVYFECSAQAAPPAHEMRWWFNGKELEQNTTQGVIISNQSLVLQRVGRQQRGKYTCSALNSVGESHSNALNLRVQHEPHCRDSATSLGLDDETGSEQQLLPVTIGKTNYGAARLESVRVHCRVEADPSESLSYKWAFVAARSGAGFQSQPAIGGARRDGTDTPTLTGDPKTLTKPEWFGQQLIYLNSSSASSPAGSPLESVLEYTPKSELDYGTLLCWATNALGEQATPCAYQVVPAERPEPVRNCRLLNATAAQLAIACEPGYDGGMSQSLHMEIYDPRKHLIANVTSIPGLSSSLFIAAAGGVGGGSSGGDSSDEQPDDLSGTKPLDEDNDIEDESAQQQQQQQRDEAATPSPQRGEAKQKQQLAASLVSESLQASVAGHQQRQRHSNQQGGGGDNQQRATSGRSKSPTGQGRGEAIFLTEPELVPSTDYLVSIYASNSKGTSKPIAFTASTSNESSGALISTSPLTSMRESRRGSGPLASSDRSSGGLMNEMFALTWSPFLLVCAVTILIFVLFASITFALIKYVDLNSFVSATGGGSGGGYNNGNSRPGSATPKYKSSHAQPQQATYAASSASSAATSTSMSVDNAGPHQQQQLQLQLHQHAASNGASEECSLAELQQAESGARRARVIAIGMPPPLLAGAAETRATNLSGGLKLSNSDNHLNQVLVGGSDGGSGAPLAPHSGTGVTATLDSSNWFHFRAPHYQAAYWAAGGTLPTQRPHPHPHPLLAGQTAQPAQMGGATCHLELDAAPAYGYLKLVSNNGAGNYAPLARHHSPAGGCELQQQQQQQHYGVSPSPTTTTTTTSNHQAIEHLLISGKQYIHQRPITAANERHRHEQQQPQRQLHMTGAHAAGGGGGHQVCALTNAACCSASTPSPASLLLLAAAATTTTTSNHAQSNRTGQADYCGAHQQSCELAEDQTPRTSDLGEELPEPNGGGLYGANEEEEEEGEGEHDGERCGHLAGNSSHAYLQQPMGVLLSSREFGIDSDGMSSQGTQKSSLNNVTTSNCFTANGSPSSGYGPETQGNFQANNYQNQLTSVTTTTGSSASTIGSIACAEHHLDPLELQHQQQQQQQLVQCNPSLRPATKSAGLRHTKPSFISNKISLRPERSMMAVRPPAQNRTFKIK